MRLRWSWPSSEPVVPCAVMRWKCTDTPSGATAIISGSTVGFPGGSRNPNRALQPIIVSLGSNDAVVAQPLDLRRINATQLAKQGLGVLAEHRRAGDVRRRLRQFDRAADGPVGAARWVVDIDDHFPRLQMRVGQDFTGVLAGAARHAGLAQYAHHLVLAALARPSFDDRVQRIPVLPTRLLVCETRIIGQFGTADRFGKG